MTVIISLEWGAAGDLSTCNKDRSKETTSLVHCGRVEQRMRQKRRHILFFDDSPGMT